MVDFRYHLVSILAVFLALAVGIVLGTSTINDAVLNDLEARVNNLTKSNEERRVENDKLLDQVKGDNEFAKSLLPLAVGDRLAGERVIVISTPGASKGTRDAIVNAIETADGTIAGRLLIQDKLADPEAQNEIDGLVTDPDILPAGVKLPSGSALHRAAAVLAAAVATTEVAPAASAPGTPTPTAAPQTMTVLSAFREANLIRIEGDPPAAASMFVVVTPTPPATGSPENDANVRAVDEVVAALAAESRAVVVAAPVSGAEPHSVLASIRRDANLRSDVSSVDNADMPSGQVAVVFALVERVKGRFGHYGTGPEADKPVPDLLKVS